MADICFVHIDKAFGGHGVLRDFNACIESGQRAAVVGPSGKGKTTLMRLLMGLETPDGGQITGVQGLRFSCAFQEERLCNSFSALENVALVLPRAQAAAAERGLRAVGFAGEDLTKPVQALSGGQRQRVSLVRAVEAAGDVLILDEAFKGLDAETRQMVFAYVAANRRGRTLFVVTHDEEVANALCDVQIKV